MLIVGAFKGHLEELSSDLQRLLLEVNHLKLVKEQVIQNQLDSGALISMQVLVENLGSPHERRTDSPHSNRDCFVCIER
jgi:hypothetical protein